MSTRQIAGSQNAYSSNSTNQAYECDGDHTCSFEEETIVCTRDLVLTLDRAPFVNQRRTIIARGGNPTVRGGNHPLTGDPITVADGTGIVLAFDGVGWVSIAGSTNGPDGPTGPIGPSGSSGPTGPTGTGASGAISVSAPNANFSLTQSAWDHAVITLTGSSLTLPRTVTVPSAAGDSRVLINITNRLLLVQAGAGGDPTYVQPGTRATVTYDGTKMSATSELPSSAFVNVLDYGATGNVIDYSVNGYNQSIAIQNALDAAQNVGDDTPVTLFFPSFTSDGEDISTYNLELPLRVYTSNFQLEGGSLRTVLRAGFHGTAVVGMPLVNLNGTLAPELVPPAPGNPSGFSWQMSTLYLWPGLHGFVPVNGLDAFTFEFYYELEQDVVGNQTFAIAGSGGFRFSDEDPSLTTQAWRIGVRGSGIGGFDREVEMWITTTSGLHVLGAGFSLVQGVVYHIAGVYSQTNGLAYLFVNPLSAVTAAAPVTQACAGTIVQRSCENTVIGAFPDDFLGLGILADGATSRADAFRFSKSARYTSSGFTLPTTKWDAQGLADPDVISICNFDFFHRDLIGWYIGASYTPGYIPSFGTSIATEGIQNCVFKNFKVESAFDGIASIGLWTELSVEQVIDNVNASGGIGIFVAQNCFNSTLLNPFAVGEGIASLVLSGAAHSSLLIHPHTEGGSFAGLVLNGSFPLTVVDGYIHGSGDRSFGLAVNGCNASFLGTYVSSEAKLGTSPNTAGALFADSFVSYVGGGIDNLVFDGAQNIYGPVIATTAGTSGLRLQNCTFSGMDPGPHTSQAEDITYLSGSTPIRTTEGTGNGNIYLGEVIRNTLIPITLSDEILRVLNAEPDFFLVNQRSVGFVTHDNTPVVAFRYRVFADSSQLVTTRIVAKKGANRAAWILTAQADRQGAAAATILGSATPTALGTNGGLPPAGWDATLSASGADVEVLVTGDATGDTDFNITTNWNIVE